MIHKKTQQATSWQFSIRALFLLTLSAAALAALARVAVQLDVLLLGILTPIWSTWRAIKSLRQTRPVTLRRKPRIEVWPERLAIGKALPVMPLWLTLDLSVPLDLDESYAQTCRSLRIPA